VAAVVDVIFEGDVTILVDMGFDREQAVKVGCGQRPRLCASYHHEPRLASNGGGGAGP
jgi:hypothetical protein